MRIFKAALIALAILGLSPTKAHATNVDPNASYTLLLGNTMAPDVTRIVLNLSSQGGPSYRLELFAGAGSTLTTGSISNGVVSNITGIMNNLSGRMLDSNGNVVSTITNFGQFTYGLNNGVVGTGTNGQVVGDLQGQSSSGGLVLNLQGTNGLSANIPLLTNYMQLPSTPSYDLAPGASAFPGLFIGGFFGNIANINNDPRFASLFGHGWVVGNNISLGAFGSGFSAVGDFNFAVSGSQIPEPMTLSLLGLGALGGIARRRRSS